MIRQITFQPHSTPRCYTVQVSVNQYSPSQVLVLWLGNGYFFPVYDATTKSYSYDINAVAQSWNTNNAMTVRAMLYDFNHELFIDVQEGQILLSQVKRNQSLTSIAKQEENASVWRLENLWVSKVEGPFQDGALVTEIDLSKKAYYLATPSQPNLTDTQILSVRWLYQYGTSTPASFNNSNRSVVNDNGIKKCKLECSFHNRSDIANVTVYPFFKEMSTSRMSSVPVLQVTAVSSGSPISSGRFTLTEIEQIFGVSPSQKQFRQELVDNLNTFIFDSGKQIHIDTPVRKAHFIAQVGTETGFSKTYFVETDVVGYTADNVRTLWKDAATYLSSKGLLNSYCTQRPQINLLSHIYSSKYPGRANGNGDENTRDGYKFRGSGLIQLTGRANYRSAAVKLKEIFPEEYVDFEAEPTKLQTPKYAVLSAIVYWERNKIWELADQFTHPTDVQFKTIRKKVNGGTTHWEKSKTIFQKAIAVFQSEQQQQQQTVQEIQQVQEIQIIQQVQTELTQTTWVNPLKNSQRTYFNFSGVRKEQNGAFGPVRLNANGTPRNHQGLDLFAEVGTPCYACLDGEIVRYANEGITGYGNVLVLKVKGEDLRNAKRNYMPEFQKEVESGPSFDLNATFLYLRYAHLKSAVITSGRVKAGDLIAHTGKSGNAQGTKSPHLHFEVAMLPFGNGTGLQKRYNPAYFVRLDTIDVNTQTRVKKES